MNMIPAQLVTIMLFSTSVGATLTIGRNKVEPVTLNLIGLPKRGTYVVKEEIEKAPVHDHPCNLTDTVVKRFSQRWPVRCS